MKLEKLSMHLFDFHSICFDGKDYDAPDEDWIYAEISWKEQGESIPITSESENEVPEDDSNQEKEEPTVVPQFPPSIF